MTEQSTANDSGVRQASAPKKLLKGGVDPAIGKKTQFKKGQSGNPAGPKPGYKHLSTHIQDLLNDEEFTAWVPDPIAGYVEFKGAPMKAITKAMAVRAMNGDHKAADWLAKYGYGTKVDVTSGGERIQQAPIVVSAIDPRPNDEEAE